MSLKPREVVFDDSWAKLKDIIGGVITLNRLCKIDKPTWHSTFSDVYMLCVAHPEPHCKSLYDETRKFLDSHVLSIFMVNFSLSLLYLLLSHINSRFLKRNSSKIATKICSTSITPTGTSSPKDLSTSIAFTCKNYFLIYMFLFTPELE